MAIFVRKKNKIQLCCFCYFEMSRDASAPDAFNPRWRKLTVHVSIATRLRRIPIILFALKTRNDGILCHKAQIKMSIICLLWIPADGPVLGSVTSRAYIAQRAGMSGNVEMRQRRGEERRIFIGLPGVCVHEDKTSSSSCAPPPHCGPRLGSGPAAHLDQVNVTRTRVPLPWLSEEDCGGGGRR